MPDTPSAFVSLDARATTLSHGQVLDRISLRDHVVDVEIGAFEIERGFTQRVSFSIVVELTPNIAEVADDVDRILSYDALTDAVKLELAAQRLNLLETLCERVADRILKEPRAARVFVRIEKLDRGPGALGVEIVRTREDLAAQHVPSEQMGAQPTIVHMSSDALRHETFHNWITTFVLSGRPVIVTHDLPLVQSFQAETDLAQRRIDLLTLEQVAWNMASKDPRCVVRSSRTELDWAVQKNMVSIWAPSKMVLDAVDAPTGDALSLSAWLAEMFDAHEMIVLGKDTPEQCNIPIRSLDPAGPVQLF